MRNSNGIAEHKLPCSPPWTPAFAGVSGAWGTLFSSSAHFPRVAVRKDGALPRAYRGNPVFGRWAGRDEIRCRLMPKNSPFSEPAMGQYLIELNRDIRRYSHSFRVALSP